METKMLCTLVKNEIKNSTVVFVDVKEIKGDQIIAKKVVNVMFEDHADVNEFTPGNNYLISIAKANDL